MIRFGLIGKNVSASLSPSIHKAISLETGIKYEYILLDVEKEDIKSIKEIMKVNELNGVNVTNPYKKITIKYVDKIKSATRKIGATNCIKKEDDDSLSAFNTDCIGFEMMMYNNSIDISQNNFIVLGSGGAAAAVAYSLAYNDSKSISIFCRKIGEGIKIKYAVNNTFPDVNIDVDNIDKNFNYHIINCTSAKEIPFNLIGDIRKDQFLSIIDINYNTKNAYKNIKSINGIDMLIYQAIFSVNYWFEKDLDKNLDINKIKERIKNAR